MQIPLGKVVTPAPPPAEGGLRRGVRGGSGAPGPPRTQNRAKWVCGGYAEGVCGGSAKSSSQKEREMRHSKESVFSKLLAEGVCGVYIYIYVFGASFFN